MQKKKQLFKLLFITQITYKRKQIFFLLRCPIKLVDYRGIRVFKCKREYYKYQ